MSDDDTQILLTKALLGKKITSEEAAHVAKVAQDNTEFRRRIEKLEGSIKKVVGGVITLMLINFLNDVFGYSVVI